VWQSLTILRLVRVRLKLSSCNVTAKLQLAYSGKATSTTTSCQHREFVTPLYLITTTSALIVSEHPLLENSLCLVERIRRTSLCHDPASAVNLCSFGAMSQKVSFSQIDLGYPPWALEFDPYSRGYLLVAGGGGEGKLRDNQSGKHC
jgi:hypothetical protein